MEIIRKTMPELLQLVVEVTFEKAKLWDVIERDDNLSYFRSLKVDKWMSPGDLNAAELKEATVSVFHMFHS